MNEAQPTLPIFFFLRALLSISNVLLRHRGEDQGGDSDRGVPDEKGGVFYEVEEIWR
jgi:hypothetical protein